MADGRFNSIAILDAIPEGEINTARRLSEDLKDLASGPAMGLQLRYFTVRTTLCLATAMSELQQEVTLHGLLPWLHLEGHGAQDESGFVTGDGTFCSWRYLAELVTPLNVATNLNVVIVLATCYGGSFARAITTIDRAPVLGVIGPTRSITVGEVETDFPRFYGSFFATGSLGRAISALTARADKSLYYRTTAQEFFYAVWSGYKREYCSEAQLEIRTRQIRKKLKARGVAKLPGVGAVKRKFRSEEKGTFNNFRDQYFMYDLFPENRTRFPVTYEQAEKLLAR